MTAPFQYEPSELEIETVGTFTVETWDDETFRCGPLKSPSTFAFNVHVSSTPKIMGDDAFIVDWERVHAYFHATFTHVIRFPSCEQICKQACSDLVAMLQGKCLSLTVTVGLGSKAAGMKARWNAPNLSPADTAEVPA